MAAGVLWLPFGNGYWMGNYHPFVMLLYSAIYSFAKESPFAYHFICLLIHLINTSVVLFLIIGTRLQIATMF